MKQTALYVLIAMWFFCSGAAGEERVIEQAYLWQNNLSATISMPCSWDGVVSRVSFKGAYYGGAEQQIIPSKIEKKQAGQKMSLTFEIPESAMKKDERYLAHIELSYPTPKRCVGSSFGFGNPFVQ